MNNVVTLLMAVEFEGNPALLTEDLVRPTHFVGTARSTTQFRFNVLNYLFPAHGVPRMPGTRCDA